MMTQAFYTGLSGIRSNQAAIDIESDNIANISTVGFRGNQAEFTSLYNEAIHTYNNLTSTDSTIGIGSRVQATTMMGSSGSLSLTDRNTDLAIDGNGWFGVQDNGKTYYTRAGDFNFDDNNDLVTNDKMYVLGTMAGNIDGDLLTAEVGETKLGALDTQQTLRFPKTLVYPPIPTKNTAFFGNLDTKDAIREFGATIIDPQNNKNNLKLSFTKSKEQIPPGVQWDVTAKTISLDGETVYDTKEGQVFFDERGALVSTTLSTINNNGQDIQIDLGKEFNGIISINAKSTNASSTSDGTIGGDLIGYEINRGAEVIATFTNGRQSSVGKIALYHFINDQGLNRINGTKFEESSNSGRATFHVDANGQNILGANVKNFQLEQSNILLQDSLTQLIILQRAFDASSKTITTADQMIQKALDMDS